MAAAEVKVRVRVKVMALVAALPLKLTPQVSLPSPATCSPTSLGTLLVRDRPLHQAVGDNNNSSSSSRCVSSRKPLLLNRAVRSSRSNSRASPPRPRPLRCGIASTRRASAAPCRRRQQQQRLHHHPPHQDSHRPTTLTPPLHPPRPSTSPRKERVTRADITNRAAAEEKTCITGGGQTLPRQCLRLKSEGDTR